MTEITNDDAYNRIDKIWEIKAYEGKVMTAMTKTQMVEACAEYEVAWFFDREPAEQREVFRHIQMHGFEGFNKIPDEDLFASCVHKGIFLMEE